MQRLSRLARRTAHLLLLEAFALTLLVFPLQLTRENLEWLRGAVMRPAFVSLLEHLGLSPSGFWDYDLSAAVNSGHEPLVLKEGLFKIALALSLLAWLVSALTRAMPPESRRAARRRLVWFLATVTVLTVGLVVGTKGSDGQRRMVWLQSRSYFTGLAGLAFFALLGDFLRCRRSADKWIALLYVLTAPLMLVSLIQHLGGVLLPAGSINVLGVIPLPQAAGYQRNAIGSLLGHNNAAALVTLPGLCLAWAVWNRLRGATVRALLASWVLLAIWVVIRSQSRSVLISFVGGTALWHALALVSLPHPARRRLSPRFIFWLGFSAAALILLQVFPNPLRGSQSLVERLHRLIRPTDLMQDTRMRTLITGTPAFLDRPVMGWGIGAFAWVYPWYQGQHFQQHEDTLLHPTVLLTPQAHNDWLQLGIELGLVGIVLVLWGLWLFWGRGWLFARRTCPPDSAPLLRGVLCAGLMLTIQAGLDFPMHVIPTALLSLLLAALAGNAPEIWGPPRFAAPLPIGRGGRALRWALVAAVALFALWPARWWFGPRESMNPAHMAPSLSRLLRPIAGEMMAESRHLAAQEAMNLYFQSAELHRSDEGRRYLTWAHEKLREALLTDPSNGNVRSRLGEVQTYLGAWDPALYRAALDSFSESINEVRNYSIYYYMAECHAGLADAESAAARAARMQGNAASAEHAEAQARRQRLAAMQNYQAALVYNPSDPYSADTLTKMLIEQGEWQRAADTLALIRRWNPDWYRRRWYEAATDDVSLALWEDGLVKLRVLQLVQPDDQVVLSAAAICQMRLGQLDQARRTIDELHRLYPVDRRTDYLDAELLVEEGRLEDAVETARACHAQTHEINPLCLEHLALVKLGRQDEARQAYTRLRAEVLRSGEPEGVVAGLLGNLAWDLFEDRALAEQHYQTIVDNPAGPTVLLHYRMALLAEERGDHARARELLSRLGRLLPTYPPAVTLRQSLEGEGNGAN